MKLEARASKNRPIAVATSFAMTTAINEITQTGRTTSKEDQISAATVVLPNNVFGSYEALAARSSTSAAGAEIPVYVVPQAEKSRSPSARSASRRSAGPAGTVPTRRFELTLQNPGAPLDALASSIDNRARFVRFEIPSAGLIGRARRRVERRHAGADGAQSDRRRRHDPGQRVQPRRHADHAARRRRPPAPSGGRPRRRPGAGRSRRSDRRRAGLRAAREGARRRGFIVLRYDRRGGGQSGGRTETATLADYADDVSAAVQVAGEARRRGRRADRRWRAAAKAARWR